jgi:signal transduction histidine kinase/CheY-like chemotaxis protein
MPSILVAIDKNYEIILWNERAQNFTHTIRENAIGKNLFSVFSLLMHYKTKIDKCLKNNEIKSIKEEKINLENKEYYFNLTVFPLKAESDEKDKIWNHEGGAVIIVDDITDYIELKKKYEQSQKMESLGQLTGGIAHDFNNILGGIQNACYLLKNNKHDKKKYDKYLNMITKLSGRASNLTNKLLNFSRIEHVSNKVINLKKIINEVTDILKSNLNKKAKIEAEFKTDRAYVRGNFSQLQTVLLNIGLNSLDAIENNGYVKYQISKTKLKNIDLDDFENKDLHKEYINITVADNGKGIPSEIQNKIFDPFFTTKNRKEGTGLGLSSAIGIIKNHGGHIDFESAENSGTKFYIYLPKYEDNRKITYKEKNKIDNPNREYEGSILVIDDEEAIRSTTKELLKISGFKVITAENGKAAINKFEQTNNEIDVVLLDMVMPDMNGNECFDKLKKINPDVPIIIISGYSSIENRKQLKNKGVQHFISKPFEIGELSEKISDILAEK